MFKVILESFNARVSKWRVTRKCLVVEQNGVKLGACDIEHVIWGSFSALSQNWVVTQKRYGRVIFMYIIGPAMDPMDP